MTHKIEEVTGCKKKISFDFKELDLSKEIKEALLEKQKTVSLKGFRTGKAPLSVVEEMYKPQVESDAINRFIQNKFYDVVETEKLKVVGWPEIQNMKYDRGTTMSFDAVVEVFPEVSIAELSAISVEKEEAKLDESEVEEQVKRMQESKSQMEAAPEGTKLQKGSFAVINFDGEDADGNRPENMKGKEFLLEIGSGQFIPGFEDGLIKLGAGDKKTVELNFPEDYHVPELKGAPVKFDVEVLEIKERKLPELSDDFAKEVGYDSLDGMMKTIKERMAKGKEKEAERKLHQDIIEQLVSKNKFDIPETLVKEQKKHLQKDVEGNLKQQGFTDKMLEEYFVKWDSDMNEKAEFQVRSGLILDTLGKKYNVEVKDSDVDARFSEIAQESGLDIDSVKKFYGGSEDVKKNLVYGLREEKTFAELKKEIKIA